MVAAPKSSVTLLLTLMGTIVPAGEERVLGPPVVKVTFAVALMPPMPCPAVVEPAAPGVAVGVAFPKVRMAPPVWLSAEL